MKTEGLSKDQIVIRCGSAHLLRPDEPRIAVAELLTRICPLSLKVAAVTKRLESISWKGKGEQKEMPECSRQGNCYFCIK